MARPLRDKLEITEWDMQHPCRFCGSPDCDPDEMDVWVTHLATWHGYKVIEDVPASRDGEKPRTVKLQQVGWSQHAPFAANQRAIIKPGVQQRELVGRHVTVVGYNPSEGQFAVSFDEPPGYAIVEPKDLDPYVAAR
jgi:hypothetical protein